MLYAADVGFCDCPTPDVPTDGPTAVVPPQPPLGKSFIHDTYTDWKKNLKFPTCPAYQHMTFPKHNYLVDRAEFYANK